MYKPDPASTFDWKNQKLVREKRLWPQPGNQDALKKKKAYCVKPRKFYDDSYKQKVVRHAELHGINAAAKQYSMPRNTVKRWLNNNDGED